MAHPINPRIRSERQLSEADTRMHTAPASSQLEADEKPTSSNIVQPMLVFKELEGTDGAPPRTIGFTDMVVEPLDYERLLNARLHEKITIPLKWRNATIVETDIEELDRSKRYSANSTLESKYTSRAIGLVKGGWLPSMLAATHLQTTILVDRNVVSQIIARFDGGRRTGREPDFLDLFADYPVRINPLLFVLEGNARSLPTPDLVAAQLNEVEAKLRRALPNATLVIGPDSLRGAIGLLEDVKDSTLRKQEFLTRVVSSLASPVARGRRVERLQEAVTAARSCGVPASSLVNLAVLSAIAVPNGGSPTRRLLKFKHGYSSEDAYNAIADLRSLEILISLYSLFPDQPVQLCTADKDLALLWTGMQASNFRRTGDGAGFSYDLAPIERLLPDESLSVWQELIA